MGKSFEIIFNLGSSHVSAARLNTKANKLELENFKASIIHKSLIKEAGALNRHSKVIK